jgi:hypothetical protein
MTNFLTFLVSKEGLYRRTVVTEDALAGREQKEQNKMQLAPEDPHDMIYVTTALNWCTKYKLPATTVYQSGPCRLKRKKVYQLGPCKLKRKKVYQSGPCRLKRKKKYQSGSCRLKRKKMIHSKFSK